MEKKIDPYIIPAEPYWTASVRPAGYPALDTDIKVDVAIVGGGLVGVLAAHLLKAENLTLALIEADRIGQGTSGRSTGKITSQHGLIYDKLIRRFGQEKAKQYAQANESAIVFLQDQIKKNKIDCDFSPQPAYVYTHQEQYVGAIEEEVKAASSLGIKAHYLDKIPLPFEIKAAYRFDNQGQFHPGKFLAALAPLIAGGSSRIFEETRAVDFAAGQPFTISTDRGHRIIAEKVILASHFPVHDGGGYYFTRMHADRSYALALTAKDKFPGGIYISAEAPGRSLRSTPFSDSELILVVGEHHRTGQGPPTGDYYRHLAQFARETFDVTGLHYRWSAQDYISVDEVPYVGRLSPSSPNVFVATGFRKWGITNSTAAALLLRDLIVRGESPWQAIYDPARFAIDPLMQDSLAKSAETARQGAAGRLTNIPFDTDLAVNEAMVVAGEKEKIGLYKDRNGQVHAVGLTCTHLGCEVSWNEAELTWDCPCHGSRYSYDGRVIEGPTLQPLKGGDEQ